MLSAWWLPSDNRWLMLKSKSIMVIFYMMFVLDLVDFCFLDQLWCDVQKMCLVLFSIHILLCKILYQFKVINNNDRKINRVLSDIHILLCKILYQLNAMNKKDRKMSLVLSSIHVLLCKILYQFTVINNNYKKNNLVLSGIHILLCKILYKLNTSSS